MFFVQIFFYFEGLLEFSSKMESFMEFLWLQVSIILDWLAYTLQNRSNLVKYLVFQYKIGIESHQNPVKFQSFVARETSKLQIIVLEQFWNSFDH